MGKQQSQINVTSGGFSPVAIVLLVIFLQAALVAAHFYLAQLQLIVIEPAERMLLLAYSAIAIFLACVVGYFRVRWINREDTVRQRLLGVIEAIPDPSAVRDLKGRYVMWNKAAEQYHGVKADHVLGKTPFELFPKEVARSILALDAECSESCQTVVKRVELPPLYGKGQRVAIIRVAPVRSATDEKLRGVVTILHDVTQSERETTELRQTSAQLKMALDTSGFGSWTWDLASNEQKYSLQYQKLLRYQGKNFSDDYVFLERLHPGDLEAVIQEAKRSIKENTHYDQVYRLRCFDEAYRYFRVSGQPVTDAQGKRQFAGLLCPLDRNAA